jgi:hypothetical protein
MTIKAKPAAVKLQQQTVTTQTVSDGSANGCQASSVPENHMTLTTVIVSVGVRTHSRQAVIYITALNT